MDSSLNNGIIKSSNSIKAIDKQTVHQICSGQVVLDLSTAVKELVENSIDAGANNIEIRLKEFGKELIEVSDNGQGIKEEDFEALALKHYTSKLRKFNDLPSVNTFGFRGEALSSLSALADIMITTHHESIHVGSKLTFDHDGKLVDRCFTAREQGTTVSISNLFYTLPVRHKEFHRTYKKDFSKLMSILYAFCLVNGTVRINCINQVGSKKNKLISTNGKNCVLDTILTIFGAKQVKSLIKIEQSEPIETVLDEYHISKDVFSTYSEMFLIDGFVSSVTHGSGRSVTDRQFYFINNRPCDFPKLARVVNEVYHSFNTHQYPFVYLNMVLNKDYVDVNVTPDKRQIMIQQENILLVIVKSTLKRLFEQNATFFTENKQTNRSILAVNSPSQNSLPTTPNMSNDGHHVDTDSEVNKSFDKIQCSESKSPFEKSCGSPLDIIRNRNDKSSIGDGSNISLDTSSPSPLDRFRSKYEKSPVSMNSSFTKKQKPAEQLNLMSFFSTEPKKRKVDVDVDFVENVSKKTVLESTDFVFKMNSYNSLNSEHMISSDESNNNKSLLHENDCNDIKNESKTKSLNDDTINSKLNVNDYNEDSDFIFVDEIATDINSRPSVEVDFDMIRIKKNYEKYIKDKSNDIDSSSCNRAFFAKISVSDNKNAEAELGKNVTKEMFSNMEILGQFNLGFIIAKLENDLFIVDQHATDEKYNYESLQRTKCLKGQRLIQPLPMNLTLVNETVLIDNLEIFQKNGFEFDIKNDADEIEVPKLDVEKMGNEMEIENFTAEQSGYVPKIKSSLAILIESETDAVIKQPIITEESNEKQANYIEKYPNEEPDIVDLNHLISNQIETGEPSWKYGSRIKLLTVPTSRNWTFSVDDVEELIYILADLPGVMCRPSRVHKMFASRACRKSIMIGTALNKQQMKRLVSHMGEIDHPWNCPHGRPTMRHLVNLNRIEY